MNASSVAMTGMRSRRHNAPVNPRREPTVVSDILLTLGVAAWVMGAGFVVASFTDTNVTAIEAGRLLARLFAGTLIMAGTITFLIGVALLRAQRRHPGRYIAPLAVGTVIGTLETLLFLSAAGALLLAPCGLIVLALHPVRRAVVRPFHRRPGRTR